MTTCFVCDHPIDGHGLANLETGDQFHPACAVGRLAQEAIVTLVGALALVVLPTIVLWGS